MHVGEGGGGWGRLKILKLKAWKLEILAALPSSLAVQFFRSPLPPLLLVLKCTNFRSLPFACLKIFGAPPQYLHPRPLVILNELSLNWAKSASGRETAPFYFFQEDTISLVLSVFWNFLSLWCSWIFVSELAVIVNPLHFHRRFITAGLSLFTFKWQGKQIHLSILKLYEFFGCLLYGAVMYNGNSTSYRWIHSVITRMINIQNNEYDNS